MSQDQIRYDILAQEALRGVIKKVLIETAAAGQLPGEHHFFITFLTTAPGVRISSALQERYPDQMTIVVQHQFWELKVTDTLFEIGLSFSDVPEKLVVPFSSVRGFYDPSVNFELEFDSLIAEEAAVEVQVDAEVQTLEPKAASTEDKTSDDSEEKTDGDTTADVVSLDAFRKKT